MYMQYSLQNLLWSMKISCLRFTENDKFPTLNQYVVDKKGIHVVNVWTAAQLRDFSYQRFKPVDDYSPDLFVTWSWSICFLRFFRTNLKFMRICCTKETHSVLYLPKAYKVMRLYSASPWASLYGDESRARRGLW